MSADWRVDYTEAELAKLARPSRDELRAPPEGWERALRMLVIEGRCPWCRRGIADVALNVGEPGVTWDCEGECNP